MNFYKYEGTGNDFILFDDRNAEFPSGNFALIKKLCDRRFGIGADGLMLLQKSVKADFYMKYYNSDGNESSMCGNGGRCIAAFASNLKIAGYSSIFEAIDGLHETNITNSGNTFIVQLKMQDVKQIEKRDDQTFVLNTGSPHFVRFLNEKISTVKIVEEAKKIRYNTEFSKAGININFINSLNQNTIHIRTYERGVEDETLSCGTGVTAAALCTAIKNDLPSGLNTINVKTEGGELNVRFDYDKSTNSFSDIWLIGPATFVFAGTIAI